MSLFIWETSWRGSEILAVMRKRENMDVMEGCSLISCLENCDITLWIWSAYYIIPVIFSTVEEPNFSLPIIWSQYKSSKICLSWLDKRKIMFFYDNPCHKIIMTTASVWIRSIIMKSYYDSSSVRARLCIIPRRSKQISESSWFLAFLSSLYSSWWVPNAPSRDHFSRV